MAEASSLITEAPLTGFNGTSEDHSAVHCICSVSRQFSNGALLWSFYAVAWNVPRASFDTGDAPGSLVSTKGINFGPRNFAGLTAS
jgi:hypothetical protein